MRFAIALPLAVMAAPALAHGGHEHGIGWTLDPVLTVPLALALLIYCAGWARLAQRASIPVRPALFLSGWTVLTL